MDLLEYGINNKDSESVIKRTIARQVLAWEKKRADFYEARLEKEEIHIPDTPEETEELFRKICEKIEEEVK